MGLIYSRWESILCSGILFYFIILLKKKEKENVKIYFIFRMHFTQLKKTLVFFKRSSSTLRLDVRDKIESIDPENAFNSINQKIFG